MVRTFVSRVLCWATLVSVAVALLAATQPAAAADATVKKMSKRRGGRLSAKYEPFVSQEQRDKIDKIQEQFKPRMEVLESQIKALKTQQKALEKERDQEIAAILTPEQKKQVADAAAAAKQKKAKPAEKAPSAPPAGDTPAK
jgi:TolA-binding protein